MLTPHTLSAGHVRYYLSLATEDYYCKGGEPPGTWWGSGAAELGLTDNVSKDQLRAMMRGELKTGKKTTSLFQKQKKKTHRPGVGMAFNLPKSASIRWARAAAKERKDIEAIMLAATHIALQYFEDHLITTRRGHGGKEHETAKLAAALFQHGTNRELEPHLHIHALLMNVCVRHDGTYGTIVNDEVFNSKKLVGAIFRAEFARLAEEELGWHIERDMDDYFRVEGVPQHLCDSFSTPRRNIKEEMDRRGVTGGKAAEAVNLEIRRTKDDVPPRKELHSGWHQKCDEHDYTSTKGLGSIRYRRINHAKAWEAATQEALSRFSGTAFSKKQLLYQLVVCLQGRGLGTKELHQKANALLPRAVQGPLSKTATAREVIEQHANQHGIIPISTQVGAELYTTKETLLSELELLECADKLSEKSGAAMPAAFIETVAINFEIETISKGYTLLAEKSQAIREILSGTNCLRLLDGKSGAAKTTTTKAIAEAWKAQGFRVIGAGPTGKVAEVLREETGIQTTTLHGLLGINPSLSEADKRQQTEGEHELTVSTSDGSGRKQKVALANPLPQKSANTKRLWNPTLDEKTVVIVDESSMVSNSMMKELLERVDKTGATVYLLGDHRQKTPVEGQGAIKSFLNRHKHSQLNDIVRQDEQWAREMVNHASNGEFAKSLALLAEHESVWVSPDRDRIIDDVCGQWYEGSKFYGREQIVLATTNKEVDEINRRCQLLIQKPEKNPERPSVLIEDKQEKGYRKRGERIFVGDPIMITANKSVGPHRNKTELTNGTLGTVFDIRKDGTVLVSLEDKNIVLNPRHFPHLRLAYAATSYKCQGSTFDAVYAVLGKHCNDAEDFYVQTSRFKKTMKLFVDEETLGGKLQSIESSKLAKRLENFERPGLAVEAFLRESCPEELSLRLKDASDSDDAPEVNISKETLPPIPTEPETEAEVLLSSTSVDISHTVESNSLPAPSYASQQRSDQPQVSTATLVAPKQKATTVVNLARKPLPAPLQEPEPLQAPSEEPLVTKTVEPSLPESWDNSETQKVKQAEHQKRLQEAKLLQQQALEAKRVYEAERKIREEEKAKRLREDEEWIERHDAFSLEAQEQEAELRKKHDLEAKRIREAARRRKEEVEEAEAQEQQARLQQQHDLEAKRKREAAARTAKEEAEAQEQQATLQQQHDLEAKRKREAAARTAKEEAEAQEQQDLVERLREAVRRTKEEEKAQRLREDEEWIKRHDAFALNLLEEPQNRKQVKLAEPENEFTPASRTLLKRLAGGLTTTATLLGKAVVSLCDAPFDYQIEKERLQEENRERQELEEARERVKRLAELQIEYDELSTHWDKHTFQFTHSFTGGYTLWEKRGQLCLVKDQPFSSRISWDNCSSEELKQNTAYQDEELLEELRERARRYFNAWAASLASIPPFDASTINRKPAMNSIGSYSPPQDYGSPSSTFQAQPVAHYTHTYSQPSQTPSYTIDNRQTEATRLAGYGAQWEAQNRAAATQVVYGNN